MAFNQFDTTARSKLRFLQHARKAFDFLLDKDFLEVTASENLLVFKNGGVVLGVFHERISYEIGIVLTYLDLELSLSDILREAGVAGAAGYRDPTTSTSDGVLKSLEDVASFTARFGVKALTGDPEYYSQIRNLKRKWVLDFALDTTARQIRPIAEAAFRNADYLLAANLYQEIAELLTPTESKKLALARRRSSN